MKHWEPWEDSFMRKFYPVTLNRELAEVLGRTVPSVKKRSIKLGIKKDADFLRENTRFPKGHVPANKGKKMPYNANSARTQFKRGALSHNTVPVGTEVVDADGYLKRKVSDRKDIPARKNWKYVHRMLWEQHHGDIPEKHIVVFKNGDKTDLRIENLDCISLAELANRNRERYPDELKQIAQLIGALNRQIRKRDE